VVRFGFAVDSAVQTDLLERELDSQDAYDVQSQTLALRPFQVVTLRVRRA
jgi:hypothetical protein